MDFKEQLAEYMDRLDCTMMELAGASGLTATTISRYRSGERQPRGNGTLEKLTAGIVQLAAQRKIPDFTEEKVLSELQLSLAEQYRGEQLALKLDRLVQALHINVAQMARVLNYDASFFSKMRKGKRAPGNLANFTAQLAAFVADKYSDEASRNILAELLSCGFRDLSDRTATERQLADWLASSEMPLDRTSSQTAEFLHKLDDFNLEDFLRMIHFEAQRVPQAAPQPPASEVFYGIMGQKMAEVVFLKCVALSHSTEPLFIYSDMDMTELSKDMGFSKEWVMALAMVLKKGQPITIIHNLNRPFYELMLGLEAYIPLYMTGLVRPFYLGGVHNTVFRHFLYVSENYVLTGEGIAGYAEGNRFIFIAEPDEIPYYRERARHLQKRAHPLMEVYTSDRNAQFSQVLKELGEEQGNRHRISSVLPVFTLPPERLRAILQAAGISGETIEAIADQADRDRDNMEKLLAGNIVTEELPFVTPEEFASHPLSLSFADLFLPPVPYSYEDYVEHLEYCRQYAAGHPSYQIKLCSNFAFRNINIDILKGSRVLISKVASPVIHFVIYQQQLRDAIENMYIPVTD